MDVMNDPSQAGEDHDPSLAADVIRSSALPIAGGVAAAVIGASIAGLPGAALGNAVGALMPEAVAKVLEHYQRRVGESAEQVVEWTAELAGMSPTELHTWAVHDDERLGLLSATIQAALSTLDREKVRTLAHVLAEAVEDDAKLDLAHVMAKSLAALDPPDVRVLKAMCTEEVPPGDTDEHMLPGAWLHSALQVRFANLGDGVLVQRRISSLRVMWP